MIPRTRQIELFCFLEDKIADTDTVHPIVVTKEELALSNRAINLDDISSCTHGEADTRLCVNARHAMQEGNKVIMIQKQMIQML